jgi:phosphatidate cytidylyltransferase
LKELLIRTLTGISLIILIAGSIILGPVPFLGIVILVYGLGLSEFFSVYHHGGILPRMVMAVSAGFLLPIVFVVLQYQWSPLWFILPLAGWTIGFLWSGFNLTGTLILFWQAIPLSSFYALGWIGETKDYHSLLPLAIIAMVWINDTFAYLVGTLLGKHKMTPRLSPGKTWEGFLGGILFTLLGGWVIYRITGTLTPGNWILISLIVGSVGLLGDLFESGLKRKMNVKNMGGLLPGHGGVLDRFDSLLFVAPALLVLMIFINLIR